MVSNMMAPLIGRWTKYICALCQCMNALVNATANYKNSTLVLIQLIAYNQRMVDCLSALRSLGLYKLINYDIN